ncbi:hypothetical protein BGX28_008995 [Mortierella sp. GBA30]|nr:hypothetical protein BGX28_008995 [Mortierella sp. GBA30]
MYSHLPGRYVLVAAGGTIRCFLGLQESFEVSTIGLSSGSTTAESNATPTESPAIGTGTEGTVITAPAPNQEIVSMDAFTRKDERGCQLIIIVSLAKAVDPAQFELRCYGANTFGTSVRELLLQIPDTTDIQTIPLAWAPTKIIHAPLKNDPFDMGILVASSDSSVHLFVQDRSSDSAKGVIEEQPIESHFPVLASFSYCENCLVIKDYATCRIVAAGTQNGTLNVGIIPRNPQTLQLRRDQAKSHTVVLFAPITTLTVYTSRVQTERNQRKFRRRHKVNDDEEMDKQSESKGKSQDQRASVDNDDTEEEDEGIHLLVTCAIEQVLIYSDINKHGLSRRSDLAECSYHDSILAAHIMDADWDGRNEIMIGTYGRQLMVFKELPSTSPSSPFSARQELYSVPSSGLGSMGSRSYGNDSYPPTYPQQHSQYSNHQKHKPHHQQQQHQQQQRIDLQRNNNPSGHNTHMHTPATTLQCCMTWNRRFASPVYGISSADLNDDGLEELVITTLNGVSFFLPDPTAAKQRLARAVARMQEIEQMKLTLEKLHKENEELQEMQRLKAEKDVQEKEEQERNERQEKEEKEYLQREKERLEKEEKESREQEQKEGLEEKERQLSENERLEKDHRNRDETEGERVKQGHRAEQELEAKTDSKAQAEAVSFQLRDDADEKESSQIYNTHSAGSIEHYESELNERVETESAQQSHPRDGPPVSQSFEDDDQEQQTDE